MSAYETNLDSADRKIIHVDMDAFFASVEQRDNADLKGKPVAVGGGGPRGVVAAASYEARRFGVRSAMPSVTAAKLCPNLIFVRPNFNSYKAVSKEIRAIFQQYTDLIEPLSLDEAYLDVTANFSSNPSATLLAKEIRKKIFEETTLTASAGISYNKFLAKIASDQNKPNGQFTIPPSTALAFLDNLPIERFFGIGKVTAKKLRDNKIFNGSDLRKLSKEALLHRFGKQGAVFYNISRGIDDRAVEPNRAIKSQGVENTFGKDLAEEESIIKELYDLKESLLERIKKKNLIGFTLSVKVKYFDFEQITRSYTSADPLLKEEDFLKVLNNLIEQITPPIKPIRLLGLQLSNILSEIDLKKYGFQLKLDFNNA